MATTAKTLRVTRRTGKLVLIVFFACIAERTIFAQTTFTDVTTKAGIVHQFGVYEGAFGGGVCILDFDNDGWEDIFLPGGKNKDQLLRNNQDGTFSDVYEKAGLDATAAFITQGAAAADVNKDGWVDILITTITSKVEKQVIPRAPNLLFLNNGNGTFRNATEEFGLSNLISFSQGASFGDVNADGYPDLFIGNYFLEFEGQLNIMNDGVIVNSNQMAQDYLLINDGGTRFINEYKKYGFKYKGFGFGGALTDFDNDGDLDVLVNHDFGYKSKPNLLMRNEYPDDAFSDVSKEKDMDRKMNAMGVAAGDYDNNGLLDYYITNIRANHFMVNQGPGKPFVDMSRALGTAFSIITDSIGGMLPVSWGANFADFDNDTDLDLFVANGCLNPNVIPIPDFYFENNNGSFTEKSKEVGVHDYGIGRGSAVFDYDNDGDLDLIVINQAAVETDFKLESATKLYRNNNNHGNWVKLSLHGSHSDTRGIGARIEIIVDKLRMVREIDGGSSHLSQSSTLVHFGLGKAEKIDSIIVNWIGSEKQIFVKQPVNELIHVYQELERKSHVVALIVVMTVLAFCLCIFFVYQWKIRRPVTHTKLAESIKDH